MAGRAARKCDVKTDSWEETNILQKGKISENMGKLAKAQHEVTECVQECSETRGALPGHGPRKGFFTEVFHEQDLRTVRPQQRLDGHTGVIFNHK